jgi:putative flippase GtrA
MTQLPDPVISHRNEKFWPRGGFLIRYGLFACCATLANLCAQELVSRALPTAPLFLSILVGTVAGFALKYLLDKRWIFADHSENYIQEAQKVALYGMFSVVTTLIFWIFELVFLQVWQTSAAKYAGAVIGITIGYAVKFALDRSFVFVEKRV